MKYSLTHIRVRYPQDFLFAAEVREVRVGQREARNNEFARDAIGIVDVEMLLVRIAGWESHAEETLSAADKMIDVQEGANEPILRDADTAIEFHDKDTVAAISGMRDMHRRREPTVSG